MPRSTIYLLCITIFLGVSAYFINQENSKSSLNLDEEANFIVADSNAINHIVLYQKGKKIEIYKNNNQEWLIDKKDQVDVNKINFLTKIVKQIIVKQAVYPEIRRAVENTFLEEGINVKFYNGSVELKSLNIAFSGLNPDEFFIKNDNAESAYIAVNEAPDVLFEMVSDFGKSTFKSKSILDWKLSEIENISVDFLLNSKQSFLLSTSNKISVSGISNLDTARAVSYLQLFNKLEVKKWIAIDSSKVVDSLQKMVPTFKIQIASKQKAKPNVSIEIFYKEKQLTPVMMLVNRLQPAICNNQQFEYILQKKQFFEKN